MPIVGEVWRSVVGCPNYEVSNCGRVRAVARWRICSNGARKFYKAVILKPWLAGPRGNRYFYVDIDQHHKRVNVLVLQAFGGQRPREDTQCRHLDGDRLNNRANNLCWGTRKENMADAIKHGRTTAGIKHPMVKVTEETVHHIRRLRANGISTVEIGRQVGLSQTHVSGICNRRYWRHI